MDKIIFFDGYCNLCNNTVRFLFKIDKNHQFKFCSLQSPTARKFLEGSDLNYDTIVLLYDNRKFYRSDAIVKIFSEIGGAYRVLGGVISLVPLTVRDWGYSVVANNRYKIFGKNESCELLTSDDRRYFLD
ncbi:MAG: thiol-disulfide oxidoreductase DCC family protein [Pseudobdellovibrio sp.]